ncbi:MAG TPA: EamA family transporter [Actinomycetales bacterium]|nr:EamA family transporter [Actinomycetales bacterium]
MTRRLPGPALVVLAASLFGTIGTARVLGPAAPAAGVGALRMLGAGLLLALLARRCPAESWRAEARRPHTLVAGLGQALFQLTFLAAVVSTGVAVGTLVAIGSAPLLAGLVSRRVSPAWAVATAVSVCGLTLLVLEGGGARLSATGVALALGAGASYAGYTLATARALDDGAEPAVTAAVAFCLAGAVLLPALAVTDLRWLASASGLAMVAYLALVPTVLAYRIFTAGLRGIAPATASTLALAEPVVATVLGVVVLGEQLGLLGWVGAALVLAGLVLAGRDAVSRHQERVPA